MGVGTRRLYMFLGGTFLAGVGIVAAACSTDNGTTTQVPTVSDSGRETGSTSSSGGSSSGSSGDVDAGIDCGKLPTVKSSDGPYCFAVRDAGGDGAAYGKNCNSAQNEICCSGGRLSGADAGFEPSQCVVATEGTEGYIEGACGTEAIPAFTTEVQEWHCTDPGQCPGTSEKCCAIASDAGSPKPGEDNDFPKGCGVYYQSGTYTGGTRCRDACQAGELIMCAKDGDCPAGKCVPLTIAGRYAGYCRQ